MVDLIAVLQPVVNAADLELVDVGVAVRGAPGHRGPRRWGGSAGPDRCQPGGVRACSTSSIRSPASTRSRSRARAWSARCAPPITSPGRWVRRCRSRPGPRCRASAGSAVELVAADDEGFELEMDEGRRAPAVVVHRHRPGPNSIRVGARATPRRREGRRIDSVVRHRAGRAPAEKRKQVVTP